MGEGRTLATRVACIGDQVVYKGSRPRPGPLQGRPGCLQGQPPLSRAACRGGVHEHDTRPRVVVFVV
ncbi:hypothetical protein B296_00008336 [Ensete ventricosum]|uniref:Uncharacterized protein n=1 Tax=Ensete ventricosum TaxID=4639 RepID=A0A427AVC7_ENSVE|nr:hypothetical protein B296_00008336 [Ensete ventricosum]